MKFRVKKLLALMLVALMVFQFGGAAGVSATINEVSSEEISNTTDEPIVSTWEPSEEIELNKKGDLTIEELKTAVLDDTDIPEVISKEAIEEKGHVNRLYEQETDLNNIIFQNRDGTKTMYQFDMAVKYIDADGKIKDKSNKVSTIEEDSKYAFVNQGNDIQTYFPKTLDKGIKTINGKTEITIIPTTDKKLDSKDFLNVTEEQNIIEYYGAFGKDTVLRYTPDYNGYKEDLILGSYQGENQFSFIVKTNGLTLVECDGTPFFVDPLTGEKIGNVGNLIIYDSGKAEDKVEYNHRYVIEKIKTDEEYLLTIVVDEVFLKSETTVYPVVIDPTLTINNSLTGSNYIQDASIHLKDTQTNFNYPYSMRIGYTSSPADTYRIVMKSDNLVSNMSVISSSNNITSAYLYVNNVDHYTGDTMRIRAYRVTKAWTETTVKCNSLWNQYTDGEGYNYYYTSSTPSGYKSYKITNMVKKWKAGTATNNGVMLKAELESSPRKWIAMASSEYSTTSKRPYLVINYETSGSGGGSSFASATTLSLNTSVSVTVAYSNEKRYFKYTPSTSGFFTFESSVQTGDPYAWLYNASQTQLHDDDDNTGNRNFRIAYHLKSGQTYYFAAGCYSNGSGSYTVKLTSNGAYQETNISGKPYNIKNVGTKKFIDIDGPGAQEWVHQWDFHSGAQVRWTYGNYTNGTSYLRAVYGNKKYIGISSTSTGVNNIKLYDANSSATQWNIYRNSAGDFLYEPKTAPGRVLHAPNSSTGTKLQLTWVSSITNNSRWQNIELKYIYEMKHYYDNGFDVRFSSAANSIAEYQNVCSNIFAEVFGIFAFGSVESYTSCADTCTGTPVTLGHTTTACSGWHIFVNHKTSSEIRSDLISKFGNGTTTISRIAWTGHIMSDPANDRSNSSPHSVIMTTYGMVDPSNGYANKSNSDIRSAAVYVLLHETSHQLGAPDHYCYGDPSNGPNNKCKNPSRDCWRCDYTGLSGPPTCIMSSWWEGRVIETRLNNGTLGGIYCSQCMSSTNSNGIVTHLDNHHK